MKEGKKSTREKLRESEEKLKDFMEAATEGFLVYDSELILREINDSALRIIGMRREDIIDKHILEITPGLEKTGRYDEYLNVIKTGKPFYADDATQLPKFGNKHLSINAFKLIGGLGIIFTDITERKKSEKNIKQIRDRFVRLTDNADEAIFSVEAKGGQITYVNLAAERLFGYTKAEWISDPHLGAQIILPDFVERQKEIIEELNKNRKPIKNAILGWKAKDGREVIMEYSIIPIIDDNGKLAYFESIGRDITERKKAERKLKNSEKKYREAYNRAEFYKDLFTHDINNILQNILSGLELTEMEIRVPEKLEKLKENITIIKGQLTRGSKLVSNIRKLSKLEEEELSIKKVEICSILKKSIAYVKNAYQDRDITIQVELIDKELYVKANELLEDLFENILINAIKYHESPIVEILIKVSREKKEDLNSLKMEFIDNGIGIEDSRKKLVFQRGNSDEQRVHGMGLGLSLVQKIIDNYEGKIWVEDRVHGDYTKGSNFVILIPEVL